MTHLTRILSRNIYEIRLKFGGLISRRDGNGERERERKRERDSEQKPIRRGIRNLNPERVL
jgi:hypothetical protein